MNMQNVIITRLQLLRSCHRQIKRFKYKKKWAVNLKQKAHSQLALDHFDTFYKPVYGDLWPLIRVSLLSQQKYCALVNNSSHHEDTCTNFEQLGAENIIHNAINTKIKKAKKVSKPSPTQTDQILDNREWHSSTYPTLSSTGTEKTDSELISPLSLNPDTNLDEFMPVEKVYSKKEILKSHEVIQSSYEARDINVVTVAPTENVLPNELRAYCYKRGDITDFPAPKPDGSKMIGYYLFDASSLLPVIALDLKKNDTVLDLCAAPGGKTLAMLQIIEASNLTCNDASQGRLKRLKDMLMRYCPNRSDITLHQADGRRLKNQWYTKVLVDAPCNNDRHVVSVDDNNLFKPGRMKERLEIPTRQKDLVIAAIKSCKPGGSVVYSTCTLSPAQNDGVIQAAAEELWQETNIDVVINDLSWMASKFRNIFNFYNKCQHGQLVIPCLTANFGPMYFCKITRLR